MDSRVVVDVDWFEFENDKHIKQLAYATVSGAGQREFTFTLPPQAGLYAKDLQRQACFSHRLHWYSLGDFDWRQLSLVINKTKLRFPNAQFFAKGHEKCLLLAEYGLDMNDLNECGCPVYKALSRAKQTTSLKA